MMTLVTLGPARTPCVSCPYRRDVPSGVWAAEEYAKLPGYDKPTGEQSHRAFFCHQDNGRLCAGWVGCHDMSESLSLRLGLGTGMLTEEVYDAALDYVCPVPLFESGTAAAAHGLSEIETPGPEAKRVMRKVTKKRERQGGDV